MVDALPYGGTCALRGCDPKQTLRRGAEIIDSARVMRGKGIDDAGPSIDWPDLRKHKHGFTDPVPPGMEDSLTGRGVTTLHGHARFTGPRRLEFDGASYEADRFLVTTGARPRPLDFPGHEHLIDSTDFLDLATATSMSAWSIAAKRSASTCVAPRPSWTRSRPEVAIASPSNTADHGRRSRPTSWCTAQDGSRSWPTWVRRRGRRVGRARHPGR